MNFNLQPILQNEWVRIQPLQKEDFDILFQCASDPLIWEQHPYKNRYQQEVFEAFFAEAMESGGAFLVLNSKTGKPIGSSRYYDVIPEKQSVAIGYTFLIRECWGTTYNRALKISMLDHAFQFAENVIFHIGTNNIRSQQAILKLGARLLSDEELALRGEPKPDHLVYHLEKATWKLIRPDKMIPGTN